MNMNTLMTGDLVVCNNGKMATVMRNTTVGNILRFHTEKDSFSYMDRRYNENFTHKSCKGLTIVRVYRVDPDKIDPSKIGDLIANPEKMIEFGKVIYEANAQNSRVAAMAQYSQDEAQNEKPTIESLLTGDMLVHRNGNVSTVYKDTPFGDIARYHTEKNSFSYLYKFDNETLEHENKEAFNIIGVFRANGDDDDTGDMIGNPGKMLVSENKIWGDSLAGTYWYKGENVGYEVDVYVTDDEDNEDDYDDEDEVF